MAPRVSTRFSNSPKPKRGVPLKIMCSKKCAMPLMLSLSMREPTFSQMLRLTASTGMLSAIMVRPLVSLWTVGELRLMRLAGEGLGGRQLRFEGFVW
jgi:hypothetical protein